MDKQQPKHSMVNHQGKEINASLRSNADRGQMPLEQHHHVAGGNSTSIPLSDLVRQDQAQSQYLDLIAYERLAKIQQTSQAELDTLQKLAATEEILATMKRKQSLEQELDYLRTSRSRAMAIFDRGSYLPQQGAAATIAATALATMNFNQNRALSLGSVPKSFDVVALQSALFPVVRSLSAEPQPVVGLRTPLRSSLPF
jgi:hypothetical protein